MKETVQFLRRYMKNPRQVGAIAPSSPFLAKAMCRSYLQSKSPARILEVGAGTGPFTRFLGKALRPTDSLDVCEINPDFADLLERDVLSKPAFAGARAGGRVRLIRAPVQTVEGENLYDFIICGLPFNAFHIADVEEILGVFRRVLKRGGVFTYFEYVAARRASKLFMLGDERNRSRQVANFMAGLIRDHQFHRETVLQNMPPARVRHLRFEPAPASASNGNGRENGDGRENGELAGTL